MKENFDRAAKVSREHFDNRFRGLRGNGRATAIDKLSQRIPNCRTIYLIMKNLEFTKAGIPAVVQLRHADDGACMSSRP
jgi:hypothetical protein